MSDQITWGEWARVLKQMEQDQLRDQQKVVQQELIDAGMFASFPGLLVPDHVGRVAVGTDNASWESYGAMPKDAETQQTAVKTTVTAPSRPPLRPGNGRGLMDALARMDASWRSDGRPHRWEVE